MRVVITGGTGLIGRALAASLAADKHEVIVLSRSPQYARSMPGGVKVEKWDGRTSAGWGQFVDGADAVDNLAGAIRFLVDKPDARGAFNLAAPNSVTNAQLAKILGRVMRRPSYFPVPAFVLRVLLGKKATLVLGGAQIVPKRLIDAGYTFKFPEAEAAFRGLLK